MVTRATSVLGAFCCSAMLGCGAQQPDPMGVLPPLPTGQVGEQGPPPNAVGGFTIEVPAETLAAGKETEPCYIFPLQVDGPSRLVAAGVVEVGFGLHHGNITTRPKTGEGVRPCPTVDHVAFDILEGGAVLFGSSTQVSGTEWQRFPPGMAFRIKDGFEIVARMHYLNASTSPLTIAPKYRWYTVAEDTVTQELTPFAWTYDKFTIPALSDRTVTADCPLDRPLQIVSMLPHMHKRGQRITAGFLGGPRDGQLFFDQSGYGARGETDIRLYSPSIDLYQNEQGTGFRFSCTWRNELTKPLKYGIGENEMCVFFGYGYPRSATYSAIAGDTYACAPVLPPP